MELLVFIGLSCATIVAYGLSRFSYGLILPAMHADLGLTFSEAGALGTANFIGYLVGAVLAIWLIRTDNARKFFLGGLVATSVFLILTGEVSSFVALVLLRFLAGVPSAWSVIAGGVLASHAGSGSRKNAALAMNLYYAGGGAGIVLSLVATFFLVNGAEAIGSWRLSWYLLGAISILAVPLAIFASGKVVVAPNIQEETRNVSDRSHSITKVVSNLALVYLCFGAGYSGYTTFVVAFLKQDVWSPAEIMLFWLLLGSAVVIGAFMWARWFARLRERYAIIATMSAAAVGAGIVIFSQSVFSLFLSAFAFGFSFLSVPAAVNYAVKLLVRPGQWSSVLAILTIATGVGQSVGPVLAGWLSDTAGLKAGLMISPVILVVGAFVGLAIPEAANDV